MPVYLILDIAVIDLDMYEEYAERVPAVVEKYGGRYLVRSGEVATLFGDWQPERIIIVEFDSIEQVRDFYDSEEYQALAPIREQSSTSRAILVEGWDL